MTEQEPKGQKGRLVSDILNKIMPLIPTTETKLFDDLNKFEQDLNYKADELQRGPECWIPFINILNYYIPNNQEIRNIVSGTTN